MNDIEILVLKKFRSELLLNIAKKQYKNSYVFGVDDALVLLNSRINI